MICFFTKSFSLLVKPHVYIIIIEHINENIHVKLNLKNEVSIERVINKGKISDKKKHKRAGKSTFFVYSISER